MDWLAVGKKVGAALIKYKYALLILALGLFLMCLPTGKEKTVETIPEATAVPQQADLAEQLEGILSQIDGAGKVRVLLSSATGEEIHYQTDEDQSGDTTRSDTVLVTGDNRAQTGLVRQVNPPTYLGAVIVCQGADRPVVQLAIVEAVSNVTGLGADRITVLKMK